MYMCTLYIYIKLYVHNTLTHISYKSSREWKTYIRFCTTKSYVIKCNKGLEMHNTHLVAGINVSDVLAKVRYPLIFKNHNEV